MREKIHNGINFEAFPKDVKLLILSYLKWQKVGISRLVCKEWREIIDSLEVYWEYLYMNHFGGSLVSESASPTSWQKLYEQSKSTYFKLRKMEQGGDISSEERDFDYDSDPVSDWAVNSGHCEVVKRLISQKRFHYRDAYLSILANNNDIQTIKIILNAKVDSDISMIHRGEESPLMTAVLKKNSKLASLLISFGADPNHESDGDPHMLSIAIQNDDAKMVKLLLQNGANADGFDWMEPPFHSIESLPILKLMISYGAEDSWDDKTTALINWATKGKISLIKHLLNFPECLANPTSINEALQAAKNGKQKSVVEFFESISEKKRNFSKEEWEEEYSGNSSDN
jgi:hypothetical protein